MLKYAQHEPFINHTLTRPPEDISAQICAEETTKHRCILLATQERNLAFDLRFLVCLLRIKSSTETLQEADS